MRVEFLQSIKDKCHLLHKSIIMELAIYDDELNHVYQFRINEIPGYIDHNIQLTLSEMDQQLSSNKKGFVYIYTNQIMLTFIAVKLFDGNKSSGLILAGPFLKDTGYKTLLKQNRMSQKILYEEYGMINNYYQSLPILKSSQIEALAQLINNTLLNQIVYSKVTEEINNDQGVINLMKEWQNEDTLESLNEHHRFEEKLLYAIERGLTKEALLIHSQRAFNIDSVMYLSNTIKNGKNILLMANILYRRVAVQGGVSLSYANSLSSKFIVLIERTQSMKELRKLSKKMIIDYSECVNNFAIKGYTPVIRQTMMYIQQNLKESIHLSTIAEYLKLNKSYLSKLFKSEVSITITDYIHKERIERACYILEYEYMSITEVASLVGYDDPNYFTRMFKKHKNMTPTEFIKSIHK